MTVAAFLSNLLCYEHQMQCSCVSDEQASVLSGSMIDGNVKFFGELRTAGRCRDPLSLADAHI